jgi:hypothetical protein
VKLTDELQPLSQESPMEESMTFRKRDPGNPANVALNNTVAAVCP